MEPGAEDAYCRTQGQGRGPVPGEGPSRWRAARHLGGEEMRRAIARRQAPKAAGRGWPALTGAREGIDPNQAVKADSRTPSVA